MEIAAWQDLSAIYVKLESWADAEVCADKAKSIEFYSPSSWHRTGNNPLYNVFMNMKISILCGCAPDIFDVWKHASSEV